MRKCTAQDPEEAEKFVAWMWGMRNIHFHDNKQMEAAIQKVLPLKYREG